MASRADKVKRILESAQKKIDGDGYKPLSPIAALPWNQAVESSPDMERIKAIPRRVWTEAELEDLCDLLTPLLKKENGQERLKPVQALSLHDLGSKEGVVCMGGVGSGKTLVSLLAPYVTKSVRPLLIIPANLREKTTRDIKRYARNWEVFESLRVESYETLSRKQWANFWETYRPDLVFADEAHHLKNTGAVVTKRLKRYLREIRPQTILALASGTLTNKSLKELWHLMRWTFDPDDCPLPHNYDVMEMWAAAVDDRVSTMDRVDPGVLLDFCNDEERELAQTDAVKAARYAVRRRLSETAGVVMTKDTFIGASLQISSLMLSPPQSILEALDTIELFETPDGWPLADGIAQARHRKELALGFYYVWDPRPPDEWLEKRKAWCKTCRQILANNQRNLDSEEQVVDEIKAGRYPRHEDVYYAWKKVEHTFKINTRPIWIDDFAVDAAIAWAKAKTGVVWTTHVAFAERLSEKSGLSYYGREGLDVNGRFIEDHPAHMSLIASLTANREGKNLQEKWSKCLYTCAPSSGAWWEQSLGRFHRHGQREDTVEADMFYVILDHILSFHCALGNARYVEDTTGMVQKLLYADITNVPVFEAIGAELLRNAQKEDIEDPLESETLAQEDQPA